MVVGENVATYATPDIKKPLRIKYIKECRYHYTKYHVVKEKKLYINDVV